MKTTNKLFKSQVQEHILNNMSEDFGNVIKDFQSYYHPTTQKLIPNRQEAFTSWLQGLPSTLDVEYTNHGIHETLKTWFENVGETYKDRDSDKEAQLYYNLVYREFNTLLKKNDLSLF